MAYRARDAYPRIPVTFARPGDVVLAGEPPRLGVAVDGGRAAFVGPRGLIRAPLTTCTTASPVVARHAAAAQDCKYGVAWSNTYQVGIDYAAAAIRPRDSATAPSRSSAFSACCTTSRTVPVIAASCCWVRWVP